MNDTGESNLSRMPNSNHEPSFNLLRQKQEKKVFFFKLPLLTSILIYEKKFPLLKQQKLLYGATYDKLTQVLLCKTKMREICQGTLPLILVHASLNKDVYTQSIWSFIMAYFTGEYL